MVKMLADKSKNTPSELNSLHSHPSSLKRVLSPFKQAEVLAIAINKTRRVKCATEVLLLLALTFSEGRMKM